MPTCKYGCGQEGKYQLKNGEWRCSKSSNSCPILKEKNSKAIKKSWKNDRVCNFTGKTPWNKGLTKETSSRVREYTKRIKQAFKENGHVWSGKSHSEEAKKKMSKTRTQMYINGWEASSCGRSKKYKYNSSVAGKITLDGKWELAASKYFDFIKVQWCRNKKRFPYINLKGKKSTYCPDFYIFDWKCYIEVKGYKTELDICKWKQFPYKLKIWDGKFLIKKGIINRNGEVTESG